MINTKFGRLVPTKERDGHGISVFHTHAHVDQAILFLIAMDQAILDADFRNACNQVGGQQRGNGFRHSVGA